MPSNAVLAQKQQVVSELAEQIKNSSAGVVVNYQGITVEDDTKMRKALREAGVKYVVVKNSLTDRACKDAGYVMTDYLKGMTAIAISPDPISVSKILKEYDEKIESFKILAGYVDGQVVDSSVVMELASIPPKEVLVAKLLGSLQSSLYGLAYVLQAKIDKENGGAAEVAAE